MAVNLSKSRYCAALQCPKILWLDINKREVKEISDFNQARFDAGTKAGELARGFFGPYALVPYSEDFNARLKETEKLVSAKTPVICEASFANEAGFCSVDILRCFDDGFEIIEVKSSTGVKPEHLDDMAFQYNVLSASGLTVKKISLMHINNKYERLGELEIQKLFAVEDCTEKVKEKQKDLYANIKSIKEIAGADAEPDIPMGKHCDEPYTCSYKSYCAGEEECADLEEDGAEYEKPPAVDKQAIRAFLDTLSYPLYFLDFETFKETIPSYDRERPYMTIPCQYSLHIQAREGEEPEHREFLAEAGTDPRRHIAERLCADIPKDVCVLAWYMSFEKARIKELADLFPDLAPHLMAIHGNIKDLIEPFKKHAWYSEAQEGSNSLKKVVPAMFPYDPELNYDDLDLIHSGGEAMDAFADLPNKSAEEQERIRAALLAYCRLDTLVMVKILQKLYEAAD